MVRNLSRFTQKRNEVNSNVVCMMQDYLNFSNGVQNE